MLPAIQRSGAKPLWRGWTWTTACANANSRVRITAFATNFCIVLDNAIGLNPWVHVSCDRPSETGQVLGIKTRNQELNHTGTSAPPMSERYARGPQPLHTAPSCSAQHKSRHTKFFRCPKREEIYGMLLRISNASSGMIRNCIVARNATTLGDQHRAWLHAARRMLSRSCGCAALRHCAAPASSPVDCRKGSVAHGELKFEPNHNPMSQHGRERHRGQECCVHAPLQTDHDDTKHRNIDICRQHAILPYYNPSIALSLADTRPTMAPARCCAESHVCPINAETRIDEFESRKLIHLHVGAAAMPADRCNAPGNR